MEIPIYQVDAFTAEPFKGNPAAVCLPDGEQTDEWMQRVAAEMNLAETAFILPREDGFSLRWFTPALEVPLCGHATLATAHILWETGRLSREAEAHFHTLSGLLVARRAGDKIELDFPAIETEPAALPADVRAALDVDPHYVGLTPGVGGKNRNYLLEIDSEDQVRRLAPDFGVLGRAVPAGVIVTARATTGDYDFVSRFFAVYAGVDEDPVTGSAHCALTPYWSRRLGKTEMTGYQASQRGGVVGVRLGEGRVYLVGDAVTVLSGQLLC